MKKDTLILVEWIFLQYFERVHYRTVGWYHFENDEYLFLAQDQPGDLENLYLIPISEITKIIELRSDNEVSYV